MACRGLILLFLLLLAKIRVVYPAGAQCPSLCFCTNVDVNCSSIALTELPSYKLGRYIQNVDFSCNNITSLDEYTIRKWMIISLIYLNISNNALRTVNEMSFMAQSRLEVIDLSSNELEIISEKTFMYVPRLKWLSLANNKGLKVLDGVPFLYSNNLEVLHLEQCGLYRLSFSSFERLSNLIKLYLSYNKIKTVEIGGGTLGPSILKITYLELSHNNLQAVPCDLRRLPTLQYVNLSYNELSNIMLLEGEVKRLNISNNKWKCLCEVCGMDTTCENVSCEIDVCESTSQKDLVRYTPKDITTAVYDELRGHSASTMELREPQQNATTTVRDYLFIAMCFLSACSTLLSSVAVYKLLRERNRRLWKINPEQSVPLTVGSEWTQT